MSNQSHVSAQQIGSYFVGQYYPILTKQPDFAHQFYTDSSTMIRVDGDSSETASDLLQIHNLVTSLNFTCIEVKTINSLQSLSGSVLVMVSGYIKAEYFSGKRNYVETFLLAPQEKGFFVLNDMFHFIDEDVIQQHTAPALSENILDSQVPNSDTYEEMPSYAHNQYDYAAEATEYVDSVNINGDNDQFDGYIDEQQDQIQQQPQVTDTYTDTYTGLEDIPAQDPPQFQENLVEPVQEHQSYVEEHVGEPPKLTYASILRAKGTSAPPAPPAISRPPFTKSVAPPTEWEQPQTYPQQPVLTEQSRLEPAVQNLSVKEEVEILKSVYVRNLPSDVTSAELEQEFKIFGKIIPDGIFIRVKKEFDVCFAFVEFEDLQAVRNAVQASPLQLGGKPIYVEERRANSSGAAPRGGRSGRGRGRSGYQSDSYRGGYGGRSSGRGGYQGNGARG